VDRLVLSDAAPLICLAQVEGLPWLRKLFGRVHITQEVREEILTGLGKPGEEALARAIERRLLRVHPEWDWLEPQFPSLGRGEASCIRAAINLLALGHDCLLLIDDREARRLASSTAMINVSGTAAVVGAAKRAKLITSASIVFDQLRQSGFRISEAIVRGILESVGEEEAGATKPVQQASEGCGKKRRRRLRLKDPR
jgi:predicted nucleic acid-binding protein